MMCRPPSPARSRGGFTLVETMVSLALFLTVLSLVSGILFQFLNGSGRMSSVMRSYDAVRMFSTQVSNELGAAMVRSNPGRWVNFKVEDDTEATTLFFVAPDDDIVRVQQLNFFSHYAYFWDKEDLALYRAVYNTATDPAPLAATASDPGNKNRVANQGRLAAMTLAYRSGSPYGWTESDEMEAVMEQVPHQAILTNVFEFNIRCFKEPKSQAPTPTATWSDHSRLPLFVEIELRVADRGVAAALRRELDAAGSLSEESRSKLRRFIITIPMTNHDINDNRLY